MRGCAPVFPGRTRRAACRGCPAAASTSPMRRWIGTPRARAQGTSRCAGSERTGARRDFTYRDLRELTSRFANALQQLGVGAGSRVFVLAGRIPELYVAVLGALKNRCVASPLFSAFGPEPIHTRLSMGGGSVLVTTESLYRRKVAGLKERLPELRHIIVVSEGGDDSAGAGRARLRPAHGVGRLLDSACPRPDRKTPRCCTSPAARPGKPKGAVHVHGAVVAHHVTGAVRARPASGGRLLVHGRSRLGHGDLLRHRLAAHQRRDEHRRRRRLRRRALVLDPQVGARERVVHRAHRGAHDDERRGGGRAPPRVSRTCASSRASASR